MSYYHWIMNRKVRVHIYQKSMHHKNKSYDEVIEVGQSAVDTVKIILGRELGRFESKKIKQLKTMQEGNIEMEVFEYMI